MRKLLILAFLFLASHQNVFPCSCDWWYLDDAYRNSISVATGKVSSIHPYQPDSNFYRIEFEVYEEFKGSDLKEFFIYDPNSPCGISFEVGDELLAYLVIEEVGLPVLHDCSRFFDLKIITQKSPELEILRSLKKIELTYTSTFQIKIPYTEDILELDFFSNLHNLTASPWIPEFGIFEVDYHHFFGRSQGKVLTSLGKNIDDKVLKMIESSNWELFDYYVKTQPSPARFFLVLDKTRSPNSDSFKIYRYR